MSIQTPPPTSPGDFQDVLPPPAARAWSPIPVTADNFDEANRAFVPMTAPLAALSPQPPDLEDIGAEVALRSSGDALPASMDRSAFDGAEVVAARAPRGAVPLPFDARPLVQASLHEAQSFVQGLEQTPGQGSEQGPGQGSEQGPGQGSEQGLEQSPAPRRGFRGLRLDPAGPAVPREVFPNQPKPLSSLVQGISLLPVTEAKPVKAEQSEQPADPLGANRVDTSGPSFETSGPSAEMSDSSVEMSDSATKTDADTDPDEAEDFFPPTSMREFVTDACVTTARDTTSENGDGIDQPAETDQPKRGRLAALHETTVLGIAGVIDWRPFAFLAVLAAYLPLLWNSLSQARVGHPMSFTVVGAMLLPLVFVIVAGRRSLPTTPDYRPVDLVVGSVATGAAVLFAHVMPRMLGSHATIVRPDLLSLSLSLIAAFVLLWGVRFAWDLRSVVFFAASVSPMWFIPLLSRDWSLLAGRVNPLAQFLVNKLVSVADLGNSQFSVAGGRTADLRGLVEGRFLTIGVFIVMVGLLAVAEVWTEAGQRVLGVSSRLRRAAALVSALIYLWVADLLVAVCMLAAAGWAPDNVMRYVGSPVVGMVPTGLAAFGFWRSTHRLGIYFAPRINTVGALCRLPAHGPFVSIDHGITVGLLAVLCAGAVVTGVRPSHYRADRIPTRTTEGAELLLPAKWKVAKQETISGFEGYFGPRSEWTRSRLGGLPTPGLTNVFLDQTTASEDLLHLFAATSSYDVGLFQPVRRRKVDVGFGIALQETYFDDEARAAWSIVSMLTLDQTGRTTRVALSAMTDGAAATVPFPRPSAATNLLVQNSPALDKKIEAARAQLVNAVENDVAALFSTYITVATSGVGPQSDESQSNESQNDGANDALTFDQSETTSPVADDLFTESVAQTDDLFAN
jgi:hypothetical protein